MADQRRPKPKARRGGAKSAPPRPPAPPRQPPTETPAQAGATKAGRGELTRFISILRELEGQPCLYYLTSPSGGPALDLHFGAKVPRRQPLDLPGMTAVQRHYEGERSLYVTCAWRLENRDGVLAGCWDDAGPHGQMRHGLDPLVGQRVRRAIAQPPAWDLALEFENGTLLRVFCDQTSDEEGADNYALFTPDTVFLVGTMSDLFIEPREADDD
jgi:hypothetical protein